MIIFSHGRGSDVGYSRHGAGGSDNGQYEHCENWDLRHGESEMDRFAVECYWKLRHGETEMDCFAVERFFMTPSKIRSWLRVFLFYKVHCLLSNTVYKNFLEKPRLVAKNVGRNVAVRPCGLWECRTSSWKLQSHFQSHHVEEK